MTHPNTYRAAGPFDSLAMLRDGGSAGDLDADEATPTAIHIGQTPHEGITVRMVVPVAPDEAADTLDVTIEVSDTLGGTYNQIAAFEQITGANCTPGEFALRFSVPHGREYMRYTATITGTAPNWGEVDIGLTMGGF
jgi:hypothetical protein